MSSIRASSLKMEIIKEISWLMQNILNGTKPYTQSLIECNEKLMQKKDDDFAQILIDTHAHLSSEHGSNDWDARGDFVLENLENILNTIKNSNKNPTENAKIQAYLKNLPKKDFIETYFTIENASKLMNCISAGVHLGKMFYEPSFSNALNAAFYLSQNVMQYERMPKLTKISSMVSFLKISNAVFSPTPSTFLQGMSFALNYGSNTVNLIKHFGATTRFTLFHNLNNISEKSPEYGDHLKEVAKFEGARRALV